jgi:hypothetical protein
MPLEYPGTFFFPSFKSQPGLLPRARMEALWAAMEDPAPLLPSQVAVWGTVHRMVAAVFLFAAATLAPQITTMAGSRGLAPVAARLRRFAVDYPAPRCFLYQPTLFWLCSADWALKTVACVSALSALAAFWGGGPVPSAVWMAISFVTYASLSHALEVCFMRTG